MPESVPLRCPACRREHIYSAPVYPCVCGATVTPPSDPLRGPSVVTHRTWEDEWVTVRCEACAREDQWPHPELGCPCGTVLRIPVRPPGEPGSPDPAGPQDAAAWDAASPPHPSTFQPVAIHTTRDAVTAAALYLRWLGYHAIRRADQRQPHGIGLAARGILAQVDPTVGPVSLRDVECLWLTAMSESAHCVYFALAGYSDGARSAADRLTVPLFVLDLTGTPQPVNTPADELATGRA
ncbi:hypothetical protein ABZ845_15195 [Streptomyces sp. NPDC047022]|uniref:hypothetical protein n=1 Tax=Streptomyces sp. NPDC047022 TaxID=3155737 RepID=UPI0033E3532D